MVFQNTPNTEAPTEMNTYFPGMKALWMAENVTATPAQHLHTAGDSDPRFAELVEIHRPGPLPFGQEAEVMFAAHHWPRWGNERIQEVLRGQRDLYAHMNNQVLHLANQGVTINQIHNVYSCRRASEEVVLPRLSRLSATQQPGRHPALSWFLGLQPGHPYPAFAGRIGPAVCRDDGRFGEDPRSRPRAPRRGAIPPRPGDPRTSWSRPNPEPGGQRPAGDVFEQIGYQQENPGLRNSYLAGAYELRTGIPHGKPPKSTTPTSSGRWPRSCS